MKIKALFLATVLCTVTALPATPALTLDTAKKYGLAALYTGGFVFMGLAACGGIIKLSMDVDKMKRTGLTKDTLLNTFQSQATFAAEGALWAGVAYYAWLQSFYYAQKARIALKKVAH